MTNVDRIKEINRLADIICDVTDVDYLGRGNLYYIADIIDEIQDILDHWDIERSYGSR